MVQGGAGRAEGVVRVEDQGVGRNKQEKRGKVRLGARAVVAKEGGLPGVWRRLGSTQLVAQQRGRRRTRHPAAQP